MCNFPACTHDKTRLSPAHCPICTSSLFSQPNSHSCPTTLPRFSRQSPILFPHIATLSEPCPPIPLCVTCPQDHLCSTRNNKGTLSATNVSPGYLPAACPKKKKTGAQALDTPPNTGYSISLYTFTRGPQMSAAAGYNSSLDMDNVHTPARYIA
jgi:hypothetical protein